MSISPVDGFVPANNLRLHYRRWSPPANLPALPPIALLHGLASSAHIWNLVSPLLADRGYMVAALDQRGHGESDKPSGKYDFATILKDDAEVFQALGIERPVLVGHSWGAMVALEYAVIHADQVTGLVLVDGATNQFSLRPNWSREQAMKDLAPPSFAGTPRETFLSYFRAGPLGQQWSPELEATILNIVQLREDETVAPRLVFENHIEIIGAMWDQPTFELYQQVRCPTTLIVAEQPASSEAQERFMALRQEGITQIHALRPDIRIVRMADTIHDIPLQRPLQLAEEIVHTASPHT